MTDLDPRAIREAADVIWPLDDMPEHERDEALRIAGRAIAAYEARRPVPDRDEMVEREVREVASLLRVEAIAIEDEQPLASGVVAELADRLDAALGPATDQEREGEDAAR